MIGTVLGALAATASVVAFAPQAWRVIKTRKTDELATMMWVLNVAGFSLWIAYGIDRDMWAIVVPNTICLGFSIFILAMKLVAPRTRHRIADVLDPAIDADAPDLAACDTGRDDRGGGVTAGDQRRLSPGADRA